VAFAVVFFSAIFIVLPALAARGLGSFDAFFHGGFVFNVAEG